VLIGADDDGNGPAMFYAGLADEVTLYDRALSGSDILAIHDAGSPGKCVSTDTEPPVITLLGLASVTVECMSPYTDAGPRRPTTSTGI